METSLVLEHVETETPRGRRPKQTQKGPGIEPTTFLTTTTLLFKLTKRQSVDEFYSKD